MGTLLLPTDISPTRIVGGWVADKS